jgi:hypothetical protein
LPPAHRDRPPYGCWTFNARDRCTLDPVIALIAEEDRYRTLGVASEKEADELYFAARGEIRNVGKG